MPPDPRLSDPAAPRPLTVYEAGIAAVVNELNNRLSAILGFTELARDAAASAMERDALGQIAAEARTAAAIVRDLIYLVRAPGASEGAAHLAAAVDAATRRRQADLAAAGVEVEVELAPGLPLVACDPGDLEMLLGRLLGFALARLRDAPSPRRVRLAAVPIGASVLLTVSDSGPALPGGQAEHELHYFRPADPTVLGHVELALAQRVAETCGAGLRLETGTGGEVEVSVTLMPTSLLGPHRTVPPREPAAAGLHILVADDDEANRRTLTRLLERHGHRVALAEDGADALARLEEGPVDVVVLDVRMPRLDGRETWERIVARWPAIARRVVFVTGDDVRGSRAEFLETAGQPVVHKPFEIAELLAAVAHVTQRP